jgi:hypothetical protein
LGSRSRGKPPPSRPRAKSSISLTSPDIRLALACIWPTIIRAFSSSFCLARSVAPASMEAKGLRTSWASTAMNWLAKLCGLAFAQEDRLLLLRPVPGIEMEGDQLGEVLEHPDDFGSVEFSRPRVDGAQSVPNMLPLGSKMGIEM